MAHRVLIGCETSGKMREAFRRRGFDAWSCDLLPALDDSPYHIAGDVFEVIAARRWDLLVVHPSCTFLCGSGMHWTRRGLRDPQLTEDALEDVRRLLAADVPMIALENPVGVISTRIRPPCQYVQPYQFGDDASKKTGLWLKNLPRLVADPAKFVPPRLVEWPAGSGKMRQRWANQTDSGQNKLPPSVDRWQQRSETYTGIAEAAAEQWGAVLALT
jgi:hypothetical protein